MHTRKKILDGLACQSTNGIWLIAYMEGSKKKIERHCKKNKLLLSELFHVASINQIKTHKEKNHAEHNRNTQ